MLPLKRLESLSNEQSLIDSSPDLLLQPHASSGARQYFALDGSRGEVLEDTSNCPRFGGRPSFNLAVHSDVPLYMHIDDITDKLEEQHVVLVLR